MPTGASRLGPLVGGIFRFSGRRNRTIARRNVDLVFGESMSPQERAALVNASFRSIGMTVTELAVASRWSADAFRAVVRLDGLEHWLQAVEAGKGVVAVSGHFGSWEIRNPALACLFDVPVSVVAVGSGNPDLDTRIREIRSAHGVQCYRYGERSLGYLATLRRNGVVSFIIDRGSTKVRRGPVDFLGRSCRFPVGYAHLARRTGAPVLPLFMFREPDSTFRLVFTEPIFPDPTLDEEVDINRISQYATRALETQIHQQPEQWAWMLYPWDRGPDQHRRPADEAGVAG